jgi:hypothetical protein
MLPKFAKMLVAAGLANEVDREDSIVDIQLTRIKNKPEDFGRKFEEGLRLQVWWIEASNLGQLVLESIDSAGSPHYLCILQSKGEDKFKADLLAYFGQPTGGEFDPTFLKIAEVLRIA